MANTVYTNLPYNERFDYASFTDYLDDVLGPTRVLDPEDLGHMRLPGNTDIFTFLLYCGQLFDSWYTTTFPLATEKPMFTPGYPDIIHSISNVGSPISADSPHTKIPPVVSFNIKRKEPASMTGGKMFGTGKHWKFRLCGDVRAQDGNIYRLRSRFWESLVEFTLIHRSGLEVENLCTIFEKFMDLNEGKFLEAGLSKMISRGRLEQDVPKLQEANVHYRTTYYYFRTQEFQFSGPITPISEVEISADPT
jgi:hypothetical protein